jgi:polysaccharide export outer membrane protein
MMTMTLKLVKPASLWSLLLGALLVVSGCKTTDHDAALAEHVRSTSGPPPTAASALNTNGPSSALPTEFSRLRVGDLVMINFSDVERPPAKVEVNIPDTGVITLPYNVKIKADGKTTTELESEIRSKYVPALYVGLTVTVRTDMRVYYVDGEVKNPRGALPYVGEVTVLRAIANVGGFTDFANKKNIELRRLNGERFIINYYKALKDPKLDMPVYPNDHIIVNKGRF